MKRIIGKVVMLGDIAVGKSSIASAFMEGQFNQFITPTILAAFRHCILEIGDTSVELEIWDTTGEERFLGVMPLYYRSANAAILVFDVTNPSTFNRMKYWIGELQKFASTNLAIIIVGNKVDCSPRQIFIDEAIDFATAEDAVYFDTSAKTGEGIYELFHTTARKFLDMSAKPNHTLRVYNAQGMMAFSKILSDVKPVPPRVKAKKKKKCFF